MGQLKLEKRGDDLFLNGKKLVLHLSKRQQNGKVIEGYELRKELTKATILNACVLDYLLKHPELIPDSWKGKFIFFWGTIYRHSDGNLFVRYLLWSGDGGYWIYFWLDDDWYDFNPAAVLAS